MIVQGSGRQRKGQNEVDPRGSSGHSEHRLHTLSKPSAKKPIDSMLMSRTHSSWYNCCEFGCWQGHHVWHGSRGSLLFVGEWHPAYPPVENLFPRLGCGCRRDSATLSSCTVALAHEYRIDRRLVLAMLNSVFATHALRALNRSSKRPCDA
jgi:hypothetical protein